MTDFTGNVYDTGGGVFNVKAFGATGDGTTSDTTAVQAALTAAKNAGGGVVFFPAGTYILRGLLLSGADGITLRGSHGAVIRYQGGLTPPLWDKFIQFDRCNGIVIEGLEWDNRQVNRFGGLEFYDCSRVWIRGNRFYDSAPTSNPDDKDRRSVIF